jgi:hypothetical protein
MTIEDALDWYDTITHHVFGDKNMKFVVWDRSFKASTPKTMMRRVVRESTAGYDENENMLDLREGEGKMYENLVSLPSKFLHAVMQLCSFVCALWTHDMQHPFLFCTYPTHLCRNRSDSCRIWEAA